MLSLSSYRQRVLTEDIEKKVYASDVVNAHFDLLKLKLFDKVRLPNDMLSEYKVPEFMVEKVIEQDYENCHEIIDSIVEHYRRELLSETVGVPAIDDFGTNLKKKIADVLGKLRTTLSSTMASYGAMPPDSPAPSSGGSGATPSPSPRSSVAPPPVAPAPSTPAPSAPSSGGSTPAPAAPASGSASGSPKPWPGWKQGFKNLWKYITRPIRRAWHDDPTREHLEGIMIERTMDIDSIIADVEKELISHIDGALPGLATAVGTAASSAMEEPEMDGTDELGEPPEGTAHVEMEPRAEFGNKHNSSFAKVLRKLGEELDKAGTNPELAMKLKNASPRESERRAMLGATGIADEVNKVLEIVRQIKGLETIDQARELLGGPRAIKRQAEVQKLYSGINHEFGFGVKPRATTTRKPKEKAVDATDVTDTGSDAPPKVTDTGSDAPPEVADTGSDAPPEVTDAGGDAPPEVTDAEDSPKVDDDAFDAVYKKLKDEIQMLFDKDIDKHPEIADIVRDELSKSSDPTSKKTYAKIFPRLSKYTDDDEDDGGVVGDLDKDIEGNTPTNTEEDEEDGMPEDAATTPKSKSSPKDFSRNAIADMPSSGGGIKLRRKTESFEDKVDRLRGQLIVD